MLLSPSRSIHAAARFDAAALQDALSANHDSIAATGHCRWSVDGVVVATSGAGAVEADVTFEVASNLNQPLLSGRCSELVELTKGTLAMTGSIDGVFGALRVFPDIAADYCARTGVADFDSRQINVLRSLRPHPGPPQKGFPTRLGPGPADQSYLIALILAGLSPACRATQAADMAQALAQDRNLTKTKLVLILGELADLVAGANIRLHAHEGACSASPQED